MICSIIMKSINLSGFGEWSLGVPRFFGRFSCVDFEFTKFYFHSDILDSQYIRYVNFVRIPD